MSAETIFITGISASGKSTLGKHLKEDLREIGIENVKLLDGEAIRELLAKDGKHFGYSTDERNRLAIEIARIALEYNREGIVAIICAICHVKKIRDEMREIIKNVMEVYLDCSVEACAKRDYKNNYEKAFKGLYDNFVGATEPYQVSDRVELVLHTDNNTIEECADILFKKVKDFLSLKAKEEQIA